MNKNMALSDGESFHVMAQTVGWKLVEKYIQDQIVSKQKELQTTEFTDLSQVARIQGEITGLKKIPIYLQDRQRRYAEALQKGDK